MRKPKFRGHADLSDSVKPCPKCSKTMLKELKPDLDGKHWKCLYCDHSEEI